MPANSESREAANLRIARDRLTSARQRCSWYMQEANQLDGIADAAFTYRETLDDALEFLDRGNVSATLAATSCLLTNLVHLMEDTEHGMSSRDARRRGGLANIKHQEDAHLAAKRQSRLGAKIRGAFEACGHKPASWGAAVLRSGRTSTNPPATSWPNVRPRAS